MEGVKGMGILCMILDGVEGRGTLCVIMAEVEGRGTDMSSRPSGSGYIFSPYPPPHPLSYSGLDMAIFVYHWLLKLPCVNHGWCFPTL